MATAPVGLGLLMRRYLHVERKSFAPSALAFGGLMGCSLAGAILFFLTTNFGSWLWFNMYDRSIAGLTHCYVAALPFFRYTLAGDMFFAFVLFGGYALAVNRGAFRAACAQPATA